MKIITQLRAEDHAHYTKRPDANSTTLEELGILPFADAPEPFLPAYEKLCSNINLLELAQLIAKFNPSQMRVLVSLLSESQRLADFGLKFGQTVYYNPSAPRLDYISNYLKAVPIGVRRQGGVDYIILATSLDNIHGTAVLVERSTILARSDFKKVFRSLLAEGKIHSPVPFWEPSEKPKLDDIPTEIEKPKSLERTLHANRKQLSKRLKSRTKVKKEKTSIKVTL